MARSFFVSYAARDRPLIDHALRFLREQGLVTPQDELVIDRDTTTAGEALRKVTRQAIEGADAVLVIWTPAAATSPWVNYELGMADALGKDVIVVAVQGQAADFPPESRAEHILEMPAPVAGFFKLNRHANGQYAFSLMAPNNEVVLSSELYNSKSAALNGIASVQSNSSDARRYEVRKTQDGFYYFTLRAANGQVIGRSETYKTAAACDAGIELVKANGAIAEVKDST